MLMFSCIINYDYSEIVMNKISSFKTVRSKRASKKTKKRHQYIVNSRRDMCNVEKENWSKAVGHTRAHHVQVHYGPGGAMEQRFRAASCRHGMVFCRLTPQQDVVPFTTGAPLRLNLHRSPLAPVKSL